MEHMGYIPPTNLDSHPSLAHQETEGCRFGKGSNGAATARPRSSQAENLQLFVSMCHHDPKATPSKFNAAPEKWWLGDNPFLLGRPNFNV